MLLKIFTKLLNIYPLYIILVLYFILGIFIYKDYGITYGELDYYKYGDRVLAYLQPNGNSDTNLPDYLDNFNNIEDPLVNDKFWGYAVLTSIVSDVFRNKLFTFYHFFNYAFFSIAIIATYLIIYLKYHSKFIAILGPFFLYCIPRLIGEIFINPFDMPFAVFFLIGLSLIYFFNHSNNKSTNDFLIKTTILGIVFGIAQSLRTWGFSLYIIYFLMALHNIIFRQNGRALSTKVSTLFNTLREMFLIIIIAGLITLFMWPYVASNPISHFGAVFQNFTTLHKDEIFYLGNNISSKDIPHMYFLTWLFATTPFSILSLLFIGFFMFFKKVKDDLFFMLFATFLINTVAFFIIKPNVFDGLRHFMFLLPVISLITVITFIDILYMEKNTLQRQLFSAFIFLHIITIFYDMYRTHPFEYTYFNEFLGKDNGAEKLFDFEYWNSSYKQAANWIINDINVNNKTNVSVFSCEMEGAIQVYTKNKINLTDKETQADYVICPQKIFDTESSFDVKVGDVIINSVTKVTK